MGRVWAVTVFGPDVLAHAWNWKQTVVIVIVGYKALEGRVKDNRPTVHSFIYYYAEAAVHGLQHYTEIHCQWVTSHTASKVSIAVHCAVVQCVCVCVCSLDCCWRVTDVRHADDIQHASWAHIHWFTQATLSVSDAFITAISQCLVSLVCLFFLLLYMSSVLALLYMLLFYL